MRTLGGGVLLALQLLRHNVFSPVSVPSHSQRCKPCAPAALRPRQVSDPLWQRCEGRCCMSSDPISPTHPGSVLRAELTAVSSRIRCVLQFCRPSGSAVRPVYADRSTLSDRTRASNPSSLPHASGLGAPLSYHPILSCHFLLTFQSLLWHRATLPISSRQVLNLLATSFPSSLLALLCRCCCCCARPRHYPRLCLARSHIPAVRCPAPPGLQGVVSGPGQDGLRVLAVLDPFAQDAYAADAPPTSPSRLLLL